MRYEEYTGPTGRRVNARSSNAIDALVGSRVRLRRRERGISQERLAQHLGITFQQLQKYERGANRIGASRLHHLASALAVPITYFFEELEDGATTLQPTRATSQLSAAIGDPLTIRLLRAFARIESPHLRQKAAGIVEALAAAAGPGKQPCEAGRPEPAGVEAR